jgi:glucokinase
VWRRSPFQGGGLIGTVHLPRSIEEGWVRLSRPLTGGSVALVIALDLGGTKIRSAIVETDAGLVSDVRERPTPGSAGAIVGAVVRLARELLDVAPDAVAVGIASAGVIDTETGNVTSAGPTIPGWAGTPLGTQVRTATGLDTCVLNDVHASACGELYYGALAGRDAGLLVAVGTGVGSAATVQGTIVRGEHGLAGTGLRIESVASGPSILRAYNHLASSVAGDLREVARRLTLGDPLAHEVVVEAGEALGRWIGPQVELIDPALVVLCGGATRVGSLWLEAVTRSVRSSVDPRLSDVHLESSRLGDHAPLLGAARQAIIENPGRA